MSLYHLKIVTLHIILVLFIYNQVFKAFGLGLVVFFATAILFVIYFSSVLMHPVIRGGLTVGFPFFVWGLFVFLVSMTAISPLMAIVGFFGTFVYFIFWCLIFSNGTRLELERIFHTYLRIQLILGFGIAVISIYQFFFDSMLFGLMVSRPYTDPEMLAQGFSKRATSFVGSPQNLGLYMGVMLGLVLLVNLSGLFKVCFSLLFITAGMLSGSAAFIGFTVMFLAVYTFYMPGQPLGLIVKMGLLGILLWIIIVSQKIENVYSVGLMNTLVDAVYMTDLFGERLHHYLKFLTYDNLGTFVVGHGLGITDRLVEVITDGDTPVTWLDQTESYMIKLFYEMGALGIITFLSLYVTAILRTGRLEARYQHPLRALLIALFGNMLVTPSFSGLTMSATLWPLVIFPLAVGEYSRRHKS